MIRLKTTLATEIINNRKSWSNVMNEYGICSTNLQRYINSTKREMKLRRVGGRPPLVDAIAVEELNAKITSGDIRTRDEFRASLREKACQTYCRRYLDSGSIVPPNVRLTARTIFR